MKAILVIDEMPKMCIGCPLNLAKSSIRCRHTWTGDTRPEWCPLKPMPDPRSETIGEDIADHEAHGWNLCLEEIEK